MKGICHLNVGKPLLAHSVRLYFEGNQRVHWTESEGTGKNRHAVVVN